MKKQKRDKLDKRIYPSTKVVHNTESYVRTFCRDNQHVPVTYIINNKEVRA